MSIRIEHGPLSTVPGRTPPLAPISAGTEPGTHFTQTKRSSSKHRGLFRRAVGRRRRRRTVSCLTALLRARQEVEGVVAEEEEKREGQGAGGGGRNGAGHLPLGGGLPAPALRGALQRVPGDG